ncbi:MAG: hypothetical protein M3N43_13960, partial [Actinomycetota bacterium]|nr:hypothetical protein [Actinomycetota bacterium]
MSWRSWWTGCVGIGGVTPYGGRREYSQTVRYLAEACEQLTASGRAGLAVPVLRKAVDRITSALMDMDDSSGSSAPSCTASWDCPRGRARRHRRTRPVRPTALIASGARRCWAGCAPRSTSEVGEEIAEYP